MAYESPYFKSEGDEEIFKQVVQNILGTDFNRYMALGLSMREICEIACGRAGASLSYQLEHSQIPANEANKAAEIIAAMFEQILVFHYNRPEGNHENPCARN